MTGSHTPLPSDEEYWAYANTGPGDTVLEALTENARRIAELQAAQVRLLAEFATHRPSSRGRRFSEFAADEVSAALSLPRHTAHAKLDRAVTLTQQLPKVLAALESGILDAWRADVIVDATTKLPEPTATQVADHVLARAEGRTITDLRRVIRRAVLKYDAANAVQRHRDARASRRVEFTPNDDGMASLWAYLPAPEAVAIHRRLDAYAREKVPSDIRSHDQRRADAFTDLALHPAHGPINVTVHLTTPAATAPDADDHVAELDGYGPISATAVRDLALGYLTTGNHRASDQHAALLDAGARVKSADTTPPPAEPALDQDDTTDPATTRPPNQAADLTASRPDLRTGDRPEAGRHDHSADGYARRPASRPRWRRLFTDPHTGAAVALSTHTYKPTTALAEFIHARDQHCLFPGCLRHATNCDIDHRTPYPAGATDAANLNTLCRHHHRLKQQPGWTLTKHHDTYTWINPAGTWYTVTPDPIQEPAEATSTVGEDPPPF